MQQLRWRPRQHGSPVTTAAAFRACPVNRITRLQQLRRQGLFRWFSAMVQIQLGDIAALAVAHCYRADFGTFHIAGLVDH